MIIQENTIASVHYRGTLTRNGEEFDSSAESDPFTFLVGHGQVIPGFEAALLGKEVGDEVKLDLTAEEAYGPHDPEAVQDVPLSQLPDGIGAGDQLEAETPDGHLIPLIVIAVGEHNATLDMNHALAGEALTFEIQVVGVREVSEEYID